MNINRPLPFGALLLLLAVGGLRAQPAAPNHVL